MPERIDFWGIPQPWGPILVYSLVTLGFVIMIIRLGRIARLWKLIGRPVRRTDRILQRLRLLHQYAGLQIRILSQAYPGIMHAGLAWGFLTFFLGTVLATINGHFIKFLQGNPYLIYKFILDLFSVFFLVGAVMAGIRRFGQRPRNLTLSPRFTWSLFFLTFIVLNGLIVESLRLAIQQPAWAAWSPAGWLFMQGWLGLGMSNTSLQTLYLISYSLHFITVALFFATLPSGTLLHIFTSAYNVYSSDLDRSFGVLAPVPLNSAGERVYHAGLAGLTWKQLLEGDACTECGRCQEVCPAVAAGQSLNPKTLITTIGSAVHASAPAAEVAARPLVGNLISAAELWACTTCGACQQACPVLVGHLDTVIDFRRSLIDQGKVGEKLQTALINIRRYGNSFGEPVSARGSWAKALPFDVKDARKEPVEYLWITGDYAALNPDLVSDTRLAASLFHRAGLDYGLLYEGEWNSGCDARRTGEEGLFEMLLQKNCEALSNCQFKSIITTDPHTCHVLKNEYPQDLLAGREVLHSTELLDRLVTSGHLKIASPKQKVVTYHDPCYLGRYNQVYSAPRRILQAAGCSIVEMPRNKANAFCCGAGGGRIWMEEGKMIERPAEIRVREAAALPGVTHLVTACPKDLVMFRDALKTTGLESRLEVSDVNEILAAAVGIL